jgi:hypothetical protein
MKKTINKLVLMYMAGILFCLVKPVAGQTNSDPGICMEITGRVLNLSSKNGNSYKVELLYNNVVLNSATVQNNRMFKFSIPGNSFYAIRISKKGYVTRLISVYTWLFQDDNGLYRFEFDTELIEEKCGAGLNADALDFPIAIISYERDLRAFYYNEEYTANIKKDLFGRDRIVKLRGR